MIAVLGVQRVLILAALVVLNIALAAGVYMYLIPEGQVKQREMSGLRSQVSTLRGDIERMQVEFEQLEEQKAAFEVLSNDGFFKDQGRRQAEEIFNDIQQKSGVGKAIASVQAGEIENNEEAQKAGHRILKSPIRVKLEAFDDVNVFHYLFLVEQYFPGHVSVEKIRIERKANINETIYRAIATGANPTLVEAEIDMIWRTMIPEERVINAEGPQP